MQRFYYKMRSLLQNMTLLEISTVHISKQKKFFIFQKEKKSGALFRKGLIG